MRRYEIDSFTYQMRTGLIPRLTRAIAQTGGLLVESRGLSGDRAELVLELPPRAGLALLFVLAGDGVEFSRAAQQTLLAICDDRAYCRGPAGAFSETVSIRLVVRFLEDAPLITLLTRSSLLA